MKSHPTSAVGVCEILVVDAEPALGQAVKAAAESLGRIRAACSIDQAQAEMTRKPADLVLVNLQVNDNGGVGFINTLRSRYPRTQIIAVSRAKRTDICLEAWRAGAADMLHTPVSPADLHRSIEAVLQRKSGMTQLKQRNLRLRTVCKQLNKARHEIRQQVDLLCNDLVRAYQEMAQQLNTTQLTVDYCQMVANEIEVEGLLRKTMEWVLAKIGPVNAAVYLSDADRRFALGAYLNLDTEADAALIAAVGDTVVQRAATGPASVAIDSDSQLDEHFAIQGATLKGRSWLATPCHSPAPKKECLAVLVVFRKQGDSLDPVRGMIEAIAPILGERIEQALELYHRMHPQDEFDDDAQDNLDDAAED